MSTNLTMKLFLLCCLVAACSLLNAHKASAQTDKTHPSLKKAELRAESLTKLSVMDKYPVEPELTAKCKNWSLNAATVLKLLPLAKPVEVNVIDASYNTLPVSMEGVIIINGKEWKCSINAGSFIWLYGDKEKYVYAWNSKSLDKYFVTGRDLGE